MQVLLDGIFETNSADIALRKKLETQAQHQGTAVLYEKLKSVDPQAASKIHANDLRRIVRALEVFELTKTPISELQKKRSGLLENYNRSGTSHIVAVSGYNIAIIVGALSILAWVLGRRLSFWVSLLFICSFVIVAGASPSVIRAGVMGMLLLLGFKIGRLYSVIPALMFAGVLMLWINPKILLADIGFQLSFCATLGIILFMPLWEELAKNWPKLAGLKSIFFVSVSAIFATLPITLPTFSQLSLVALPANLLVLPAVPLAMLFGFLTVLPITAPGFAFLANGFLTYILLVVETLGQLPMAVLNFQVGKLGQFILWLALGLMYWGLKYLVLKKNQKDVKISCK
jgi:competence protein ComEC